MPKVNFTLNGSSTTATFEVGMHVLEVLRDLCGIKSPKDGCAPQGYCGCCTILVDGRPALACLRQAEQLEGRDIVTLEGLPQQQRQTLARAFVQEGAIQCGYCIPGIVTRAAPLLSSGRTRDRQAVAKALSGHLCRCTGYQRILDAIQTAGEIWDNGGVLARTEPRRSRFFRDDFGFDRKPALHGDSRGNGVGTSSSKYRGLEHALGEKDYVGDLAVAGMLHGAVVLSDHPRAKVVNIDAAATITMPGVERVFTAEDVVGERRTGLIVKDWPAFVAAGETTRCVGDMIALVVADTSHHARQAATAMCVEYEVLDPVTDPQRRMRFFPR
jgi:xanthine dehydrogenase molybdenum-binding subunit